MPKIKKDQIKFYEWNKTNIMEVNKYGILEPPEYCEETIPNLLLVPLLAYDVFGNRVGYGGGYYDKTLILEARKKFKFVQLFKPKSSRNESKEIFLICMGFNNLQ